MNIARPPFREATDGQVHPVTPPSLRPSQNDSTCYLSNQFQSWVSDCPRTSCTFWAAIINEAHQQDTAFDSPKDIDDFLHFSEMFLSPEFIATLRRNLLELSESDAGIEFTLRHHNAAILAGILCDLQELTDGVDDHKKNPSKATPTHTPRVTGGTNSSWSGQSSQSSRNHTNSSNRENPPTSILVPPGLPFQNAEIIVVQMEAFTNPEKNSPGRGSTIRERSLLFRNHCLIREIASETALYNPKLTKPPINTQLFHGTRQASVMNSFYQKGIRPPLRYNEFAVSPAFYTTNDPQQAFEHTLHNHFGRTPSSPIAVLQFNISTDVLHGEVAPAMGEQPFQVKRFLPSDDIKIWQDFCVSNMMGHALIHQYDIVIGPLCIPSTQPFRPIQVRSTSVPTTQMAFCTPRSFAWLNQKVKKIYLEERLDE
ncbi:hypothetical protein Pst134EA_013560 [Puccinia striiformis f. sp. tritici]|uniref:hypothetical protein n=1 Tax=Puccinia striiformis f. sp. tritici TaxID=168172 RepID=UPI0020079926|nr:hypothetical protein Pst134EA_013560 [Puccinia striiformis f. sp. tritici]KAH9465680.1 hypothetical protein Pst134EA_013560 [Puccinia striiformis f. sp. tritici]